MLAAAPGLEYYQERRLRSLKLLDEGGTSTYDPFNDSFGSW
jgi:[ribulose-bisphosphate carboxylase]-lysine N-methyltransferase